ncbi:hypothetical protein [Psychroflexus sediminis]|uniref:Peptidylprolyl isomerase n=1 Tax=Psychroflexus sediminis TaxID=470826 RepID=A0A1G7WE93_9FLAO|nr:hypothetical protein [Psychroflexus sediminis]SDG70345.1 hypothetical protein SAMN04488027_105170 [Psychroflexus sediminis]
MKTKNFLILILISVAFTSCSFFSEKENTNYVARVNDHYLTFEELGNHISNNLSYEDSAITAKSYIQNWATDKLLLDRAKLNLPEDQQNDFRELSKRYEEQLFKKAYKDALIRRELTKEIDSASVLAYYRNNSANFKLNEDLVQLRYLQLDKKMKSLRDIKRQFLRFNPEDMLSLQEKSLEFKSLSLKDSIWVRISDVMTEFKENKNIELEKSELLKERNFLEFESEDGNDIYFIYINSILKRNEEAPLSYVRPTIEQILLNRKKTNISKKIEKEITKDATKNNEFEVY